MKTSIGKSVELMLFFAETDSIEKQSTHYEKRKNLNTFENCEIINEKLINWSFHIKLTIDDWFSKWKWKQLGSPISERWNMFALEFGVMWIEANWRFLLAKRSAQNNQAYYHNVNAFPKTLTPLLTYLQQRMRIMITMQNLFAKALVLTRSLALSLDLWQISTIEPIH